MNLIKTTSTIALTLLMIGCSSRSKAEDKKPIESSSVTKEPNVISLKLHQKIPKSATIKNKSLYMTTSGAMEQMYIFRENNNTFEVMTNEKGFITFIKSTDHKFISSCGIKEGDSLEKVKKISNNELKHMLGWGYYIPLSNGWFAKFSSGKDREIPINSKVDWLFKSVYH